MDSTERGVDPRDFAPAYRVASGAGLRRTGHAGEDTGPDNIRTAIAALGLERIDHGIAVVEDPDLLQELASRRIPFDVCPSSNVVIANRYPSLAEHPFRQMRDAGLLLTINTDDPAMTAADLGTEYRRLAEAQGYAFEEMCRIALEGVDATWLDDGEKTALTRSFEREIAAIAADA
jgi:adenosine deaminase